MEKLQEGAKQYVLEFKNFIDTNEYVSQQNWFILGKKKCLNGPTSQKRKNHY